VDAHEANEMMMVGLAVPAAAYFNDYLCWNVFETFTNLRLPAIFS